MSLTRSPAQWCASFLLLVAAGTHIPLIQDHLEEAPYVGWLFIALSVVCIVLAVAILFVDSPGVWIVSGAVCLRPWSASWPRGPSGCRRSGTTSATGPSRSGSRRCASEALMVVLAWAHLRRTGVTARAQRPESGSRPPRPRRPLVPRDRLPLQL